MIFLGQLMFFISFTLLAAGLIRIVTFRRSNVLRRIQDFSQIYDEKKQMEEMVLENGERRPRSREREGKNNFLSKFRTKLEIKLEKADLLLRPEEYCLLVSGFSLLLALVLYSIRQNVIMAIIGILMGIILSRIFVDMKKNQRLIKINGQLVDAITLISNGLKAGYSFFQAAEMVATDMKPPIANEFKKMILQMNLGVSAEEALKRLGTRVESPDMDLVITAILIQRQIGGNLAEVLDNISSTIRERVKLHREIKSKTAQGRLSGIILILLPPSLAFLIFLASPDFMSLLFTNTLGWLMIGVAFVLQVIGIFFILKIINIEV